MCVKVGIHPSVGVHRGFAGSAFIEASSQQKMDDRGIAKNIRVTRKKLHSRADFHTISAPSELSNGRGVSTSNEVAPEGLLVFGDQFDDLHRKGTVLDVELKPLNELVNVVDDRGGLDQGVNASDVDSFSVSNRRRELFHGLEEVHRQGGAVLASGEAKHPRDVARFLVQNTQFHRKVQHWRRHLRAVVGGDDA